VPPPWGLLTTWQSPSTTIQSSFQVLLPLFRIMYTVLTGTITRGDMPRWPRSTSACNPVLASLGGTSTSACKPNCHEMYDAGRSFQHTQGTLVFVVSSLTFASCEAGRALLHDEGGGACRIWRCSDVWTPWCDVLLVGSRPQLALTCWW
jgi:hypothetical protein